MPQGLAAAVGTIPATHGGARLTVAVVPAVKALSPAVLNALPACNTALVLYSFRYDGSITEAAHDGVQLRFLGAFPADE